MLPDQQTIGLRYFHGGIDYFERAPKTRTMSLFNQGSYWYRAIPNMREERLEMLMEAFGKIIADHAAFKGICSVI